MRRRLFPDARYWGWRLRSEAAAILLIAALVGLFLGVTLYAAREAQQPPETIEATVIRFGSAADYDGDHPLVTVRTPDGRTHQVYADSSSLFGCMRGSTVRLTRRGSILRVEPDGCRPLRA